MKVELTYGETKVALEIPEKNLAGIIEPKGVKIIPDTEGEFNRVLDSPHGPMLEDLSKSKSVCVLVEDHTRDEPHWELLSAVIPRLRNANNIQFIVTTGSHEVNHPGNLEIVEMIHRVSKDNRIGKYSVEINDCRNSSVENLGTTSRGTPIIVSSNAVGHDVYVPLADMKAHYFAGYSNALKDFLPGVCAFDTIEANHSMALDPNSTFGQHPYHPDPERRNNPLADDMREGMEIIVGDAKVFTLSIVTNNRKLIWADAGLIEPVTAQGFEILDEMSSFSVTPVEKIIVSPGGYPQDKSLYHAQRAIELTKNAVKDKGEVLFVAECRDGVAPESAIANFYTKLTAPLDEVTGSISERYHLYEHKAYKFAELLKRVSKVWMYTEMDTKTVEDAHLFKTEDPQKIIDDWISDNPAVKILVLDKGNKIAVYKD
ncbi:MAG: lactate racemase domain-containing protein [Candidatus Thorarchaeota archaeon]